MRLTLHPRHARERRQRILRRVVPALVLTMVATLAIPGRVSAEPAYPFQDPDLPIEVRVGDLLARLTLDEKLSLLHQSQVAIPRLDIPYFKTGTEALHGVAWSNDFNNNWNQVLAEGTVFPQAVGLASTWDPALVEQVGTAVGAEVRGYHALDPMVWGTQVWSPVVNLLRDPRWGRNEEGYSEDPLLTGMMSTSYGNGLTGDDPVYLQTAPVLKHYLAYNNEVDRSLTSSSVPPRVLHEYDEAAFRPAIAAGAATGVMASYNLVNGRPTHLMRDLDEVVRSWTDQELYSVSDAWAPRALVEAQHYYDDYDVAYANMLQAGLDSFTIDGSDTTQMRAELTSALDQGLLSVADVDTAVRHVLSIRMRLGHFDPDGGPYADITPEVINSPEHQELNRQTAESATVLLRNSADRLPLDPERTGSVVVVGPLHDTLYRDWYGGNLPYEVTPLDGIRDRLGGEASVTGVEALDRIALRDTVTGGYLTATGTGVNDSIVASGTSGTAATTAQWDVNDWMGDVSTLSNVANGRYLTGNFGPFNTASETIDGWFVQQQFRLEEQADGTYLIQYVGYETNESWWWIPEHYVTVAADGTVGTGSKADAARFAREVVTSGTESAVAAAEAADAAVVVVGSHPFVHGRENHDRATTALGVSQQALVEAVTEANPNTVVVLETSYPVTMDTRPKSLLWTTHAGSETGNAIAGVLFGDINPAGRLPQTWYRSDGDLPADLLSYDIISTEQTYQYFQGRPLFPFGHGLSYTDFRYDDLRLNRSSVDADGTVRVSVEVTNTGRQAGDEVVQLYTHQRSSRDEVPVKLLQAFERVSLAPGQSTTVRFTLPVADLAHWDVTRDRWVVESSTYDLLVGASSGDIRERAALRVRGETIPPRDLSEPTRTENFDAYAGAVLVDESRERGTAVAGVEGDWVQFTDVALGRRATTFTASVANAGDAAGSIQIRLDSPTGRLVGTATVASTGDVYAYTTTTASLSRAAAGTRDVYLVFGSDLRLATFSIH